MVYAQAKKAIEAELKVSHPLYSRVPLWFNREVNRRYSAWEATPTPNGRVGVVLESALEACKNAGLENAAYLITRELDAIAGSVGVSGVI